MCYNFNMSWLILVAIAVLFDVFRIFTDNYISDVYFKEREVASQKMFSAWSKTIVSVVILIIAGFSFEQLDPVIVGLIVLSGVLSSIAEIFYYWALGIEDSTNLGIFIQLAPIMYLILGWMFLGETVSPLQLLSIAIILVAPILIVVTTRKRSRKVKMRAILLAFLYVLVAVIGNIVFVNSIGDVTDIRLLVEEIALAILGTGLMDGVIMLCMPKWRRRYRHVVKKSRGRVRLPLFVSFALGLVKSYAYRAALVAAPALALASAASDSVEPIVIFFMGLVLTLIWPNFGREKLDRKTVLVHLAATVIVVAGIVLMQF